MIEVIVVAEGQTEETFIRDVLAPSFVNDQIYVQARLIRTSPSARGGALNYQRVLRYLRNTLRQRSDTYVTTFFDLYGLDNDFPGYAKAKALRDPADCAGLIERELRDAVVREASCQEDRFFPHVQPYEFEALLFSDIDRLVEVEPDWRPFAALLNAIRDGAESPEHINDGPDTHPFEHLRRTLRPRYQKTLHGPLAVLRIGLDRIAQECRHFAQWLERLRGLRPNSEGGGHPF